MSRIPNIGPRARYIYGREEPIWMYQIMDALICFTKERPEQAAVAADDLDPTVSPGRIEFNTLSKGGLFTHLAAEGRPLVVEEIDNPGNADISVINVKTSAERTVTAAPFKVAAGECVAVNNGAAGSCTIGLLVRHDIPAR